MVQVVASPSSLLHPADITGIVAISSLDHRLIRNLATGKDYVIILFTIIPWMNAKTLYKITVKPNPREVDRIRGE